MSRPRDRDSHSESFNVRWHSVVDATTPSVDIMSSPDPLNDTPTSNVLFSSGRRVTRSQRSDRFLSLDSSPKRQTFELQVGDDQTPQKLLVTVETDDGSSVVGPRRKLFQSLSPAKRPLGHTTTTTVPLRDETPSEDTDPLITPGRRGRPRKSNGTPMPSAGRKRRAGTPIRGTPRRPRTTLVPESDDAASEASADATPTSAKSRARPSKSPAVEPASAEATPTSTKRGARPSKSPAVVPSSERSAKSGQSTTSLRRSRRRRQALAPDELIELADAAIINAPTPVSVARTEDEMDLVNAPSDAGQIETPSKVHTGSGAGSDIWMATLSNEATPKASAYSSKFTRSYSDEQADPVPVDTQEEATSEQAFASNTAQLPATSFEDIEQAMDDNYGFLLPAASDDSSVDERLHGPESQVEEFSAAGEQRQEANTTNYVNTSASEASTVNDDLAEPVPRNDTIAQGEDFSMIFMDSIPSLQADFKSSIPPTAQDELGDETNLIINNTLDSLRQEVATATEDVAEMDAVEPLEHSPVHGSPRSAERAGSADPLVTQPSAALSPGLRASPRLSRSPRKTPISSPLRHRVLKFTARQTESSTSAAPELGDEDRNSPESSRARKSVTLAQEEESNIYEDSFSEIPQEILEAATPRRPGKRLEYLTGNNEDEVENPNVSSEDELAAVPINSEGDVMLENHDELVGPSNASNTAQSEASRLPTPEDTPPHIEADADSASPNKDSPSFRTSSREQLLSEAAQRSDAMGQASSSRGVSQEPPAITFGDGQKPEATPLNQMSSPIQQPQSLIPEPPHDRSSRLLLSPIVRAGRVLQSVTSDPPSPEGRDRQLGSPFRSSGSKESLPGSKDSQNSRRISKSPPLFQQEQVRAGRESQYDSVRATGRESSQISQDLETEEPEGVQSRQAGETLDNASAINSMRVTPPSDGAMSWVQEAGPLSARLRGDNSLMGASQRRDAETNNITLDAGQLDGAIDGMDESQPNVNLAGAEDTDVAQTIDEGQDYDGPQSVRDDETDIWEIEAERETPKSTRQKPFGKRVSTSTHRRGTIPSPWTKAMSKKPIRLSGGFSGISGSKAVDDGQPNESTAHDTEEYSLLEQSKLAKESENAAPKESESATKASRFDLSSFFSSPAAIPGMLASTFLPAKAKAMFGSNANQTRSEEATTATVLPTSTMFPQASQPEAPPRASPKKSHSLARSAELKQQPAQPAQTLPQTPERAERSTTVAQKQNFTPRPRQAGQSILQPSSGPSAAVTPPRMQLSHADIHRWQQETSHASEESPDLPRRLLRPLPPKNASPTKSSLRSPLKPHTPGRVVEFTSSVLSPADQAKARHQRQMLNSSLFQELSPAAEPVQPEPVQDVSSEEDQNSSDADVSMSDAPPLTGEPSQSATMSQTLWTRQHWLFLDELLQMRRKGPFDVAYDRRSERYLHKSVRSHGEEMVLERWHLDCVDAFTAEVSGWGEGDIAKRLFALIVGEKRRRQNAARPRRAMFH